MSTFLDSLVVGLTLDNTAYLKGLHDTVEEFDKTRKRLEQGVKLVGEGNQKLGQSIDGVTKKLLGFFAAFVGVSSMTQFMEQLTKADTTLGNFASTIATAPRDIAALGLVLERIGGDAGEAATAFGSMANTLGQIRSGQNAGALQALTMIYGLGTHKAFDVNASPKKMLYDIAEGLAQIAKTDPLKATTLGKSAGLSTDMIALMERYGSQLRKMSEAVKDLAPSDKDVKISQDITAAWAETAQNFAAMARVVRDDIAPLLITSANAMTATIQELLKLLPGDIKQADDIANSAKGGDISGALFGKGQTFGTFLSNIKIFGGHPFAGFMEGWNRVKPSADDIAMEGRNRVKPSAEPGTGPLGIVKPGDPGWLGPASPKTPGTGIHDMPYGGHGPGRTPSGLASWRWEHRDPLSRTKQDILDDTGQKTGPMGIVKPGDPGWKGPVSGLPEPTKRLTESTEPEPTKRLTESTERLDGTMRVLADLIRAQLLASATDAANLLSPTPAQASTLPEGSRVPGGTPIVPRGAPSGGSADTSMLLSSMTPTQQSAMVQAIIKQENSPRFSDPNKIHDMLFGAKSKYRNLSISQAMNKWAPGSDPRNNPKLYAQNVANAVGNISGSPSGPSGPQSGAVDDLQRLSGRTENDAAIKQYIRTGGVGMDPHLAAWCAMMVNAGLAHQGIQGTTGPLREMAGSFANWGRAVAPTDIRKGDVAEYRNGAHVGFVESGQIVWKNGVPGVQMIAGNEFYSRQGAGPGRSQVGQVGHHWMPLNALNIRRSTQPTAPHRPVTPTPKSRYDPQTGAHDRDDNWASNERVRRLNAGVDQSWLTDHAQVMAAATRAATVASHTHLTSNSNSREFKINQMVVNSAAADAGGIATDIHAQLRRTALLASAQSGPS